ncbi:MAG TPA: hypothetical protein VMX13_16180 [Sedimentisphaerales bacterium]|nr:hypothetical protein [Sedimentisphaerales bacterium]
MAQANEQVRGTGAESLRAMLESVLLVVIFSLAFAYIEAAVVVYLRVIFHPDGFSFPLTNFGADPRWKQLLLTEMGREGATLVLLLSVVQLLGRSRRQRFALFLAIFGMWDIFFYFWLKVIIDWPVSLMDWDVLFLIPVTWAGPVLAPVLVSAALIALAVIILSRSYTGRPLNPSRTDWMGFVLCAITVVVSFCVAGLHITEQDFEGYFHWPLFGLGCVCGITLFLKLLLRSKRPG